MKRGEEITPPELDCGFMFAAGILSLLILLFIHGKGYPYVLMLSAVNFFNGWRLYRKIKSGKNKFAAQAGKTDPIKH